MTLHSSRGHGAFGCLGRLAALTGLTMAFGVIAPLAASASSGSSARNATSTTAVAVTAGRATGQHTESSAGLAHVVVSAAPEPHGPGYWDVFSDGTVLAQGGAPFLGDESGKPLNAGIVGIAVTPDGGGYWLLGGDGGVFSFGDAKFHGSTGDERLNKPVVGIAATPDGLGYWLVASDGGVFTFGDAHFEGSTGNEHLNEPVVGMAASPTGLGYWLVASDGGVFSFNVPFEGSAGNEHLNQPVVGVAASPTGLGYWLVASDGGVFSFGNAHFYGSAVGDIQTSATGIIANDSGGYTVILSNGSVIAYPPLSVAGLEIPSGVVDQPYSFQLVASGGETPYTWTVTPGYSLPPGLTLDPDGLLHGTPPTIGSQPLDLTLTDGRGSVLTLTGSVEVLPAPLDITTTSAPNGRVGVPYSTTFAATGGTAASNIWSGTSLPAGLTLSPTGVLSGTPTTAGPVSFTVTVSDSYSYATQGYDVTIAPAGP